MILNPKAKGSRREREVRDIFLAKGYDVVKGGGSLGRYDLVCVARRDDSIYGTLNPRTILIQVKSNHIDNWEVCDIAGHGTTAQRQIWIKKDRKPWEYCIIEDGEDMTVHPTRYDY